MSAAPSREPVSDRLRIVSHFPGRLRVRADTFRLLPDVAEEVRARVAEERGVLSTSRSPITGSILVAYDPRELQLPRLIAVIVRASGLHGLALDVDDAWKDEAPQGARVRNRASALNDLLRGKTQGTVDLRTALPGALAGGGLLMLLAGKRQAPAWYDLMMWSLTTFSIFNPPQPQPPRHDAEDGEPEPG